MRPGALEIRLAGDPVDLGRMVDQVDGYARANAVPDRVRAQVQVALDEVVSNVFRHGAGAAGRCDVTVRLDVEDRTLVVVVEDDGPAFDPLQHEAAPPEGDVASREPGGLGIVFVKTLMDGLDYRRAGGRNILRMRKLLTRDRAGE